MEEWFELEKIYSRKETCFELRNTGIGEAACQCRIKELAETMSILFKTLKRYKDNPEAQRYKRSLNEMLSPLLMQFLFAHKRALPQWKSIKENSCGHDFPSCDSHWLNYFKKIADKISNSVCFFPYSVLQSTAYSIDRCSAGSGIIKTGSLCTRLRGN